jgi:hypothetical protein
VLDKSDSQKPFNQLKKNVGIVGDENGLMKNNKIRAYTFST